MEFLGVQKLFSEKQMKIPSKKKRNLELPWLPAGPVGYQGWIFELWMSPWSFLHVAEAVAGQGFVGFG